MSQKAMSQENPLEELNKLLLILKNEVREYKLEVFDQLFKELGYASKTYSHKQYDIIAEADSKLTHNFTNGFYKLYMAEDDQWEIIFHDKESDLLRLIDPHARDKQLDLL